METYRQTISDIRSMNKLLFSDQIITDRVILGEIISAANLIVGQSLEKRKYWQSPTLFTPIKCLELEPIPLNQCCEYTGDRMVAISKISLPKIGEGQFGLAIQGVFGADGSIKFKPTNPNRYTNLLKLSLPGSDKYFWLTDDMRVVVTNEDAKLINLYAYFTEMVPNNLLYPGKDCDCLPKPTAEQLCRNPLDNNFHFISNRMFDLKQLVYKNLMSVYHQTAKDVTSNQLDETSK